MRRVPQVVMNTGLGWALALGALVVGYVSYGWQGLVLALSIIVFWLLLQFSRALRALRQAAGRPVGSVESAVMLHAKLHAGMRLPQILKLTRSLGRQTAGDAAGGPDTSFVWTDAGGDSVSVQLRDGRLGTWTLHRAEAGAAPPPSEVHT